MWRGPDQPRAIRGRHLDDCPNIALEGSGVRSGGLTGSDGPDACPGCLSCPEPHCQGCGVIHDEHVCPGCLSDARADLGEIVRMCEALPAEAIVKGVDSEAFNLTTPVADVEAFGHRVLSATLGRIDEGWLEVADDTAHPLWTLGTVELVIREALGFDEPEGRVTVTNAAEFVNTWLASASRAPDLDWRELARELSRCRAHVERVLHDGEQVDQGAPCLTCEKVRLVRVWAGEPMPWEHRDGSKARASEDGWACPKCRQTSTEAQYRFAVAATLLDKAEHLTAAQLEEGHGVKATRLRKWVERGQIKPVGKNRSGHALYVREDVLALRDGDTLEVAK